MISERDQVLERHTFPNWLRVVSHSRKRKGVPPATIPQCIETSTIMETPLNLMGQGMLLMRFILHIEAYFEPQGISLIRTR